MKKLISILFFFLTTFTAFAQVEKNPDLEKTTGIAKLTNFWKRENDEWKLAASLSFDRKAYENKKIEHPIFEDDVEIEKWLKEN